jgi:hypothetical protein
MQGKGAGPDQAGCLIGNGLAEKQARFPALNICFWSFDKRRRITDKNDFA